MKALKKLLKLRNRRTSNRTSKARRLTFESLENRELFAGLSFGSPLSDSAFSGPLALANEGFFYSPTSKTLSVYGSSKNDKVVFNMNATPQPDINTPPQQASFTASRGYLQPSGYVQVESKTILGPIKNITFWGYAGDDHVTNNTSIPMWADGGNGNDTLIGGFDADSLFGGNGDDTLIGGSGADSLVGGNGDDTLKGGYGHDSIYGGDGHDQMSGGDGNDYLSGSDGNDQAWGGEGDDTISGSYGNDSLHGDSGQDTLYGDSDDDSLFGGTGHDKLFGGAGHDTMSGDDGNDVIEGGEGNDSMNGGLGNDSLDGQSGNDTVDGGNDDDTAMGGSGDDTVNGGSGNDKVYGGEDNDKVNGDSGNDFVYGGEGHDTLSGGGYESDQDYLEGGSGNDTMYAGTLANPGYGSASMHGGPDDDTMFGSNGADALFGGPGNDKLYGNAGSDTLDGGMGDDQLFGGPGDDELFGNVGDDQLYGDAGNDWLEAGSFSEFAEGGSGWDFNAHRPAIGPPTSADVDQEKSPTCVFLASLAGLAETDPDVSARIKYLGNYMYRVLMFRGSVGWVTHDIHFDGTFNTGNSPNNVAFGGLAFDGSTTWYDPSPTPNASTGTEDYWTILMQRAYRQELAAIDELDNFTDYELALTALTGVTVQSDDWDPQLLRDVLLGGGIVVAGDADDEPLTVPHHAYTVMDVVHNGAEWIVTLRNPWGVDNEGNQPDWGKDDGIIQMTWNDFYGSTYDFDNLYYTTGYMTPNYSLL